MDGKLIVVVVAVVVVVVVVSGAERCGAEETPMEFVRLLAHRHRSVRQSIRPFVRPSVRLSDVQSVGQTHQIDFTKQSWTPA